MTMKRSLKKIAGSWGGAIVESVYRRTRLGYPVNDSDEPNGRGPAALGLDEPFEEVGGESKDTTRVVASLSKVMWRNEDVWFNREHMCPLPSKTRTLSTRGMRVWSSELMMVLEFLIRHCCQGVSLFSWDGHHG